MESWRHAGIVFVGGGLGTVMRWAVGAWLPTRATTELPWGTAMVNLIGSFAIGLLAGVAQRGTMGEGPRLFLIVGILGGFTTFSAFSIENAQLLREGHAAWAFANIALQVGLGLGLAVLGFWMGMARGPQ